MKKVFLTAITLFVVILAAQAKSWKVGPASVVGMDFASINDAMSGVSAGDTLYLDQYYNDNTEQTVTKRVVIIGTGYDTAQTDEQVVATLTSKLHLKTNGVIVKSTCLNKVLFYNDDCILDRCYAKYVSIASSTAGMNHIYSCYIDEETYPDEKGAIKGYSSSNYSQIDIQNCLIYAKNYALIYLTSSIIKNNTIIMTINWTDDRVYCLSNINNSQIKDNIILRTHEHRYDQDMNSDVYSSGSGNSIEHNIFSHKTALTYFPTNKTGYGGSSSELFIQSGSYSEYYKVAENSAAKGYATDGGEVGCHGGMFGCPSGGRPQYIPYFTKVVVGSRSENGKLPVSVSVKIQTE